VPPVLTALLVAAATSGARLAAAQTPEAAPGSSATPPSPPPPGVEPSEPSAPSEAPPPVTFPEDEAPPSEAESQDPTRPQDEVSGYEAGTYSDHALVAQPSSYKRRWDFTLGLQYAWLKDQLALGPVGSIGQDGFWLDLEIVPVFTLNSAPELEGNYLGQRFTLAVSYAPLDTMNWRVRFGVGGDAYALWGINSEEWKGALALRADVTYWPVKHFGVELGVRGYPLSSDGLSVERGPGGAEWLPFFVTTTLYFRSPGGRR
jgi:hypothetical protein